MRVRWARVCAHRPVSEASHVRWPRRGLTSSGPGAPIFQDDEGKRPSCTTAPTFGPSSVLMAACAKWSQPGWACTQQDGVQLDPACLIRLFMFELNRNGKDSPAVFISRLKADVFRQYCYPACVVNCFSLRQARGRTCQMGVPSRRLG